MEADLGVDTVKQAEVFAAVREQFDIPRDENLKLRDFPTLAHVIGFVRDRAPGAATPAAAHETQRQPPRPTPARPRRARRALATAAPTFTGDVAAADRLPRRIPVPVLRPPAGWCLTTGVTLGPASRVVVMADEGRVAEALVKRLGSLGVIHTGAAGGLRGRRHRVPAYRLARRRCRCRACTGLRRWTPSRRLPISTSRAGGKHCGGGSRTCTPWYGTWTPTGSLGRAARSWSRRPGWAGTTDTTRPARSRRSAER